MGFSSSIERTRRIDEDGRALVIVSTRFHGRPPLSELVPRLMDVPGVRWVSVRSDEDSDEDHEIGRAAGRERGEVWGGEVGLEGERPEDGGERRGGGGEGRGG